MTASILVFPGSNCDVDIANSINSFSGKKAKFVWYNDKIPKNTDLIVIPGGFSFGDYLRSGSIASTSTILSQVKELANKGVPILGICNGFQILTEAKLLPGTLILNNNLKFICKEIDLKISNNKSIFTKELPNDIIRMPIAHKMGNYRVSQNQLSELIDNNQIAFRYSSINGQCDSKFNPNGSVYNIAGVLSENNKILGMMPHPERYTDINKKDIIMKKMLKLILK